jgi:hypothetical protein
MGCIVVTDIQMRGSSRSKRIARIFSGHVAQMQEMRNAYKILVGKSEWKKQLGRNRNR